MESWSDLAKQLWWEMTPQTNYHGTPYTFNKFDDSKFLTGEGFMAHGPGHYSANDIKVAEGYRKPTRRIYNKLIGDFVDINPNEYANKLTGWKLNDYLASYLEYSKDRVMPGDYVTRSTVEKNPLAMDVINNPENYDIRINKGNLYKVNVPNENFMWNEKLPFALQNKLIQRSAVNSNDINFIKYMYTNSTGDVLHNLSKTRQLPYKSEKINRMIKILSDRRKMWDDAPTEKHLRLINRLLNNEYNTDEKSKLIYDMRNEKVPMSEMVKDMQKLYGPYTKGIIGTGRRDGGINVTFSGKDIRMANTIPQQIRNRIPVQTLGKMARKIYSYPVVKGGVKFLDMFGPSLAIPDVIKLTHPNLYPYTNRDKQRMKQILEKKYNIKIDGNRITL